MKFHELTRYELTHYWRKLYRVTIKWRGRKHVYRG